MGVVSAREDSERRRGFLTREKRAFLRFVCNPVSGAITLNYSQISPWLLNRPKVKLRLEGLKDAFFEVVSTWSCYITLDALGR